jgi:putative NADH-flavin reductase
MKIAIIGATGLVGTEVLSESLARGHEVTAIVRNPDNLPTHPKLRAVKGDVTRPAELASLVAGHDVVISAFNPGKDESGMGAGSIIDAAKRSGVKRLLVVGGAGSLEIAPGKRLVDQPDFPAQWKGGALRTAAFLDQLLGEADLDWAFVSPAAMLVPGERTGKYRVGGDQFMTDGNGESRISLQDYAVAMLDEAERPQHHHRRFSVAY